MEVCTRLIFGDRTHFPEQKLRILSKVIRKATNSKFKMKLVKYRISVPIFIFYLFPLIIFVFILGIFSM